MPKSSAAGIQIPPAPLRKKRIVIKEEEQLYLVRKSARGSTNGFRHHRPRDKRVDEFATEKFDPATSTLDFSDNQPGAINKLLSTNEYFRTHSWPPPFDKTTHRLRLGDARDLSWIPNQSVHLVVTSPPYWTLKKYEENKRQLGEITDYNSFLNELEADASYCQMLSPFFKTPLRDDLIKEGLVTNLDHYERYNGYWANVKTRHISSEDLQYYFWYHRQVTLGWWTPSEFAKSQGKVWVWVWNTMVKPVMKYFSERRIRREGWAKQYRNYIERLEKMNRFDDLKEYYRMNH